MCAFSIDLHFWVRAVRVFPACTRFFRLFALRAILTCEDSPSIFERSNFDGRQMSGFQMFYCTCIYFLYIRAGECSDSTFWENSRWNFLPENADWIEPKYTTADYIYHLNPQARFIMMIRNPIDRLGIIFVGYSRLSLIRSENQH